MQHADEDSYPRDIGGAGNAAVADTVKEMTAGAADIFTALGSWSDENVDIVWSFL